MRENMTTSVCMGIYNGEKYIEQQLYSILHQTREPDQVVLCDDGSRDRSVVLVQEFIEKNNLQDKWFLYQNKDNKGYPANFYYAMSLCTQEAVFLADQDDIWDEKKLEQMCRILEQQKAVNVLCCKFGLIDGTGRDIHTIMAPTHTNGTGELRKVTIEDVFYKCEWPGMVLAYRNAWYQGWSGVSVKDYQGSLGQSCHRIPHDLLLCARAAEEDGFYQTDQELAYHRRHDRNTGGEEHRLSRLLNKKRKLKEIQDYLQILDAFSQEKPLQTAHGENALQDKSLSMHGRYDALQSGKIYAVLRNAWTYRRHVRLATVVCDALIVKRH